MEAWPLLAFDTDYEINQMAHAMRGYQNAQIGDFLQYWRFDKAHSQEDDLFDEGIGGGKVYHPSVVVPVLHVTHNEGGSDANVTGFYFNDDLYATISYDQFNRTGLTQADVHHERYLKDRMLYDGLVFRVASINILGQINQRDTIVSIEGTQVKPDEMSNDPQFAQYAVQPNG